MQAALDALAEIPGCDSSLSTLSVKFGNVVIHGEESKFHKTADKYLQNLPQVTWDESLGECTLAYFDPDAPQDPTKNGPFGNWQWLVTGTGCVGCSLENKENECMPHDGPNPPEPENHRCVFVLFQHTGEVKKPSGPPKEWNFYHFIRDNGDALKPVAVNFFWCDYK
eukprot:scaffold146013_cov57-Attheya_sp.AAC.2